jgi:hypothetical protein
VAKGVGAGLLRHELTQPDLSGTPTHLEVSSRHSRTVY